MTELTLTGQAYQLLLGDCLEVLRTLPTGSVQCCVTSPPYFGLRAYLDNGHEDKHLEVGTEHTPDDYVARLVEVFGEVRRVLHPTGTCWINLGDSYANDTKWGGSTGGKHAGGLHGASGIGRGKVLTGLKPKDLIGIPWMVAFALRADGWYLRSEIIWAKTNCMPESVTDRPTKSHEYIFLLSKSAKYFYDHEAVREPSAGWPANKAGKRAEINGRDYPGQPNLRSSRRDREASTMGRNKRSVWTVATKPYPESHFAVFPEALIEPCILAGTSAHGCCAKCGASWERVVEKVGKSMPVSERHGRTGHNGQPPQISGMYWDGPTTRATDEWQPSCTCNGEIVPCTVLDPFSGSGTTLAVALRHGRNAIGIELNPEYIELAHRRIERTQPMLLEVTP